MAKTEKCDFCGVRTTHLHTGGDAEIPEPGACSNCEPLLAVAAQKARSATSNAAVAAFLQKRGLVPSPAKPAGGGP